MKKTKYASLGFKFSLMVFIMIFVSASVIGVTSYYNFKNQIIAMAGNHALGVADSIATAIDGDKFSEVDETNVKNDYYDETMDFLNRTKEKTNFAFVYTMVDEDEDNFKYVMEGAAFGETEGITDLGDLQLKDEYGPEPLQAIKTGKGTASDIYFNGEEYGNLVSAFSPIFNSKNEVVGVVGVDIRADNVLGKAKAYIPMAGIFIVVSSIILFLISIFFIRRNITSPLHTLMDASNQLSVGNIKVDIVQKSKDEIGQLMGAFKGMVENIEQQSENLKKIAEGDLSIEIIKRSEDDVLADSMQIVVDNLNDLNTEVNERTESIMEGKLSQRSENSNLKGKYKEVIEGVNYIQDSFVNILDSIDTGILIVDKEYNLKFGNTYSYNRVTKDRKSIINKKCYDVYECDRKLCRYDKCMKHNEKQSFEETDTLSHVNYQTDMLPYKDKDGNTRGIIEVNVDISEIKKAEKIAQKQLDYQEKEIDKVVQNLTSLAKGNLSIQTQVSQADDDTRAISENFIKLNSSLSESTHAIKLMIDEAADILLKMSNKDFSVKIDRVYVGDFTKLKDSINHIVKQFNLILKDINTAAEQVEAGADQVASSSQGLSQGASEQASSVEEIGATVTEVADQTTENAGNANRANDLSMKAKSYAEMGNEQMQAMLSSMNEIKESSKSIANIIKVIDEIAFQTNILALNAAVEAARAGEHGKGFAVVAEEVRNLAARSAKAAKETTDLIDNSIVKVDEGYKIANDTATALNRIVEGVGDTVEIVGKIAQASNQQSTAISEINRGIEQVSTVTQSNTATAEESASASEEMAAQAQTLKGMIQEFRLNHSQGQDSIYKFKKEKKKMDLQNKILDIDLNDDGFGKY